MRVVVIGVAAIACSTKPPAAPMTNSVPGIAADSGPGVHPPGELPSPAMRLTNCVADNGDGNTTKDEAGHITEQWCAMIYDCSGGMGAPKTATSGGALLRCNGSGHATCTCEITHASPTRVDTFSFEATNPCDQLDKLFASDCSTLYQQSH